MAVIGTHQIGYFKPEDSKIDDLKFKCKFNFSDINFIHEKRFGHDKWVLNLGQILNKILSEMQNEPSTNNFIINIKKIRVVSFKKGLFQWSSHLINIGILYEILDYQKNIIDKGEVIGQGSGSGKELGKATYVPVYGNLKFDKAIELAIYRCYENCLRQLCEKFKKIKQ